MTMMSILATSDNGNYFEGAAKASSMSAGEAKSALERLCPAIAAKLKSRAQSDNDSFEALLDLRLHVKRLALRRAPLEMHRPRRAGRDFAPDALGRPGMNPQHAQRGQ